jgi:cell division transport system ATP-binding protein
MEELIKFTEVSKSMSKQKELILDRVNIEIGKGELVYLTGASGSGKTMLLKMIYREAKPSKGQVFINGKDIARLKNRSIAYLRRNIGVVHQDYKLLEKRTVYKNISYALEVIGKKNKEIDERVNSVLKFIDMTEKKDCIVKRLSSGEKQRVAIARAIINNPDILLCDEVTANLNNEIKKNMMILLSKLNEAGTTIIFATHDEQLIKMFPGRVIQIDEGVVVNEN